VEAGGNAGLVVALDPRTGEPRWASKAKGWAGHSGGLTPITVGQIPCVAVLALQALVVIRLDEGHRGETLHEYPYETQFANSLAQPVGVGSSLLISSGFNQNQTIRLDLTPEKLTQRWVSKEVAGVHPPVVHNGSVYVTGKRLACLDWETGATRWSKGFGGPAGSMIMTADERLVVFGNKGDLMLVEGAKRSPTEAKILAEKRNLFKREAWPYLAMSSGYLVLKDRGGNLATYALTPPTARPAPPVTNTPAAPAPAITPPAPAPPAARVDLPADGLLTQWRVGQGDSITLPDGTKGKLTARGEASLNEAGHLVLAGGAWLLPPAVGEQLLAACRQTQELTLELAFRADVGKQAGPARLLSFSADPYNRNFTLGQADQQLILRLRTPRSGNNGMPDQKLATAKPETWQHLQVSYRDGQLLAWLNGEKVADSAALKGDFSNWTPMTLLLGNEAKDERPWRGQIAAFAVLAKALDHDRAQGRFKAWQASQAAIPK
jgi:hypothetical protein